MNQPLRLQVSTIEDASFDISIRIAFYRARHLGSREQAAVELEGILMKYFRRHS